MEQSKEATMQVIIFDKFFKCIYRLHNIPREWNFRDVASALKLTHDPKDYEAFRLADYNELCIDDYEFVNGKLRLTDSWCS